MHIIFDDNGLHKRLAPFTLTRPVAEVRFGILTIKETWLSLLSVFPTLTYTYDTEAYLSPKFEQAANNVEAIRIMGNIKPGQEIAAAVGNLRQGEALYANDVRIAVYGSEEKYRVDINSTNFVQINRPWHIFERNAAAMDIDFKIVTQGRESENIGYDPETVRVSKIGAHQIFVEEGAILEHVILNASSGPIYIGKGATIMEGAIIRGPFAINEGAVVKMGAKIYGATTIGPECKVGGEISNSVFQAYSNKGHDGFLGNSVIGEWCNLGADTNSSNLKNNYSNVRVYNYETEQLENSDILFCGLLMGDHSKTGINTMLNTATVVGISANIFGGGFPPKYIPSFTWGGVEKTDKFKLDKAFEVAENMMKRRHIELGAGDKAILSHIFENLA